MVQLDNKYLFINVWYKRDVRVVGYVFEYVNGSFLFYVELL